MARRARDWVDLARAKRELRIHADVGDFDDQLIDLIDDSVAAIEDYLDMPLIDRTVTLSGILVPRGRAPAVLPPTPGLRSVDAVKWRASTDDPYAQDLALGASPVLEAEEDRRGTRWRYWPDAAWPAGACDMRFEVTAGLDAFEERHAHIRTAIVLRLRDLYDGVSVADRRAAWQRVREGTVYNPVGGE